MDFNQYLMTLPGIGMEEVVAIKQATQGMNQEQLARFISVYMNKRKNPQDILLFTLAGIIGFAGLQRIMVGQVAMGLVYFFTGGLCLIGTIVDLVNYKNLAAEYNRKMMIESMQMLQMYP